MNQRVSGAAAENCSKRKSVVDSVYCDPAGQPRNFSTGKPELNDKGRRRARCRCACQQSTQCHKKPKHKRCQFGVLRHSQQAASDLRRAINATGRGPVTRMLPVDTQAVQPVPMDKHARASPPRCTATRQLDDPAPPTQNPPQIRRESAAQVAHRLSSTPAKASTRRLHR